MFEKAARLKLRFDYKGLCTAEDLWDIPLKHLDSMYQVLNEAIKLSTTESLLSTKSDATNIFILSADIVKHVVTIRLAEIKERTDAKTKSEKKKKLLEIVANKQDVELQELSVEALTKLIDEL